MAGDAEACHALGKMMLEGEGGPRSKKKAEKELTKACDMGLAESCALAGEMLYARKDSASLRFLKRACVKGDSRSCGAAGWMLWWGEGCKHDLPEASRRLEQACAGDDGRGCALLGLLENLREDGSGDEHLRRACSLGESAVCGDDL